MPGFKKLFELAAVFLRLGVFLVGGGYAMLPMLRAEVVGRKSWLTDRELLDGYAIGQSTPGIIAVNVATLIGYGRAGVIGAVTATVAILLPALTIIIVIAAFFDSFHEIEAVQRAFGGMRVAVAVLLLSTVASLVRRAVRAPMEIALAVAALAAVAGFGVSPVPVLLAAAAAGLLAGRLRGRRI